MGTYADYATWQNGAITLANDWIWSVFKLVWDFNNIYNINEIPEHQAKKMVICWSQLNTPQNPNQPHTHPEKEKHITDKIWLRSECRLQRSDCWGQWFVCLKMLMDDREGRMPSYKVPWTFQFKWAKEESLKFI